MFEKILIANRGEIAVRVIRTARRMGIATVAVYCDADRESLHVEMADEAIAIGPPPASASYLVIDRILDACRRSGADAVHPGYGFLSERAEFAIALQETGIVFIGPNPKAIAAMGDKIESKKLALTAGVSTVPGRLDALSGPDGAVEVARQIGLPVMIKASAGGGGKGMRVARSEDEVRDGFRSASSEARSSFGDDRVFIEKYIENPRHIEIQVLGDRHGNLIHLGERECSIQRRHQKILEEAPSPAVDAAMRAEMGRQAVLLAQTVGYDSAGTVEFVAGADGGFYFLEMNTRLQVEHPVTEMVTGIDLVEQMIRVAAGEPLAMRQEDVRISGWAIEARLYAEDPYRDFLPSIGRLDRLCLPREASLAGTRVRVDSGVVEGDEVSIYFDPMLAKIIAHGPDRAESNAAMAAALDATVVEGIGHNQPFLAALIAHPRWQAGKLSTAFIEEEFPGGFRGIEPANEIVSRLSMIALDIALRREGRLRAASGAKADGHRVVAIGKQRLALTIVGNEGGELAVLAHGAEAAIVVASAWRPGEPLWSGTVGGVAMTVQVRPVVAGVRLAWRGVDVVARVMTPRVAELEWLMPLERPGAASTALRCPMPGLVISLQVEEGQKVRAGQPVATIEAMKMENVLRAERDGTVSRVVAKPGDILAVDAVVVEFA